MQNDEKTPENFDPETLAAEAAEAFGLPLTGPFEQQIHQTRLLLEDALGVHSHLHPNVVGTEAEIDLLRRIREYRERIRDLESRILQRN